MAQRPHASLENRVRMKT